MKYSPPRDKTNAGGNGNAVAGFWGSVPVMDLCPFKTCPICKVFELKENSQVTTNLLADPRRAGLADQHQQESAEIFHYWPKLVLCLFKMGYQGPSVDLLFCKKWKPFAMLA